MSIIKKNWIAIVFIISFGAILSALGAEYFLNKQPCQMCLYQRYPYYIIMFFSVIFFIKQWPMVIYFWICFTTFILGLIFSLWHVGIEEKILPPLSSCSGKISSALSIEELKNQIITQSVTSCDQVTWKILGISAATVNSLLLIGLITFSTIYLFQHYYGKEKKNNS